MISEMLASVRRTASGRKILSSTQKATIVLDWEQSGLSCPAYCRRYGLISSQLYKWRSDAKSGAIMGIQNEGELHSKSALEMLRRQNEELKKALGEATLDIKILKKKLEWDAQRNKKLNSYPSNLK